MKSIKRVIAMLTLSASMLVPPAGLSITASAFEPPDQDTKAKEKAGVKADLPKAKDVIEKHIEAIGGRKAIKKYSFRTTKGKFSMPAAGMEGTLVTYSAAPNKVLVVLDLPSLGEVRSGFDGTVAWTIDPMRGPSIADGKMLEDAKRTSDFYADLHFDKIFKSMETTARTTFDDRDCFELKLTSHSGDEMTAYYDVETGLLIGQKSAQETPMGKIDIVTQIGDYTEFGGTKIASTTTIEAMGQKRVMTVEAVAFDEIEKSVFDLPEEIKALVEAAEEEKKAEEKEKEKEKAEEGGGGGR